MHQPLSGRRERGGFTLIEVLAAAALLAVAILFVSTMFPAGYSNVDAGGEQTEAAILAHDMLEKIKGARWTDVASLAGNCPTYNSWVTTASSFSTASALMNTNLTEWKGAVESRVRGGVGTLQVCIFTPSYTPSSKIATVVASVHFSQGIRGTKTVTMGTRISE